MTVKAADGSLVHDTLVSFDEDHAHPEPKLIIKHEQFIPDDHIAALKRDKVDTLHTPTGDFYRVASVPVSVWDEWRRRGIDPEHLTAREIVRLLNNGGMDAFITTTKRI